MNERSLITCAVIVMLSSAGAFAANSVLIESRTLLPGQEATIGIFITNDVDLQGLTVPLEFRAASGTAYPDGPFALSLHPDGRIAGSGLLDLQALRYANSPIEPNACSGPLSHMWPVNDTAPNANGSPDAVLWAGSVAWSPDFAQGADGEIPALLLALTTGSGLGTFAIDTCCFIPTHHIRFVKPDFTPTYPAFTKGLVTVVSALDCAFECHADPFCDTVTNIFDIVSVAEVAFRDGSPIPDPDPTCPRFTTDADCSGATDIIDIVLIVNVAFRDGLPEDNFCDPCAP